MTPTFITPVPYGIDAETGRPLPNLAAADIASLAGAVAAAAPGIGVGGAAGPATRGDARTLSRGAAVGRARGVTLGTVREVDPNDLAHTGWGVLFGANVPEAVRDALHPLLEHRRKQTEPRFFRVFDGPAARRPKETARQWVERMGSSLQTVDPMLGVPYYLLVVAAPDDIPFEFQYVLDIHWAVGRLYFDDVESYRRYAESVMAAEAAPLARAKQVALFAPVHDGDPATEAFRTFVADPLVNGIDGIPPLGQPQGYGLVPFVGDDATRQQLVDIYAGSIAGGPPALLFTGTHGVAFKPDDDRLPALQGALLCQDWQGGKPRAEDWLSAADLPDNANLSGLIQILFACYGGGCPAFDTFSRAAPRRIAPRPIVAKLPQALLAHAGGGALAVIGHVDRAWAHSFVTNGRGPQIQSFRDVIGRLLTGTRAGHAMDQFNQRWSSLAADLAEALSAPPDEQPPAEEIATRWIARDDARNYVLFGDPAVRL